MRAVELHGNLAQNARTRNMDEFHSGRAAALVATDIAARGIHVDDVALVIHADPPADHKAYLHRSGRTARAGHSGTVITLATREQLREVRDLTRIAGITATTTQVPSADHPVLAELAPGARTRGEPIVAAAPAAPARQSDPDGARRGRSRGRRRPGRSTPAGGHASSGGGRTAASGGAPRGGSTSTAGQTGRTGSGRSGSGRAGSGRSSGSAPRSGGSRHSAASFSTGRR